MVNTNGFAPTTYDADVIVIGAGISGSAAAKSLHDQGVEVLIVEANDRIGGRTWTEPEGMPGGALDKGGMFIGETHKHLIELGTSLGLEMTPSGKPGDDTYMMPGARSREARPQPVVHRRVRGIARGARRPRGPSRL